MCIIHVYILLTDFSGELFAIVGNRVLRDITYLMYVYTIYIFYGAEISGGCIVIVSHSLLRVLCYLIYKHLFDTCVYTVQGDEAPYDALSCRLFFAKEPFIVGLFCGR